MRIGVFDSGIGGITVLKELRRRLPDCEYVYLGDTANVPYGAKSPAQIELLSSRCTETLLEAGVGAVVVACNTASSWALPAIRRTAGEIPVFGVVEPGVEAAIGATAGIGSRDLLVLATRATVSSGAYGRALREKLSTQANIAEQACPLLVPMIEEGWIDHPILHQTIAEYVGAHRRASNGVALLACTHYPWIQAAFTRALPGWAIVNSAEAVSRAVSEALAVRTTSAKTAAPPAAAIDWRFTDPQAVPAFARAELAQV